MSEIRTGTGLVAIAAGGTGGHVTPAEALGVELERRGWRTFFATDRRGRGHVRGTHADLVVIPAGGAGTGAMSALRGGVALVRGTLVSLALLIRRRPDVVVGFGGYASLPLVLAAILLRVPACLHEQNAVLGRVNRRIAPWVRALATSFPDTRLVPARLRHVANTGNPVRAVIAAFADAVPYRAPGEGRFEILVFGGSQGAAALSALVPEALSRLPDAARRRLVLYHQARAEDEETARAAYERAGIAATVVPYFEDMPDRLAAAGLVIARAGASTVAELAAAGRPAILMPFPAATDDHQTWNARYLADEGAAWFAPQASLTPAKLATLISELMAEPGRLCEAAAKARSLGRPEAAAALADLVEETVRQSRTPRHLSRLGGKAGPNGGTHGLGRAQA